MVLLLLVWRISENRCARPGWRWIGGALLLQLMLALLIVRVPFVWSIIGWANDGVAAIEQATRNGPSYMFGYLGGGDLPFALRDGATAPLIIAFKILPLVIVFSALAALLWHWGVLAWLVNGADACKNSPGRTRAYDFGLVDFAPGSAAGRSANGAWRKLLLFDRACRGR